MKKIGVLFVFAMLMMSVFAEEVVYAPIGLGSRDDTNFVFHDGKDFYVANQLNGNYAKIPDKYISASDGHIIITYPYNATGEFKLITVLAIPGEYYSLKMTYPGENQKRSEAYYEAISGKSNWYSYSFFNKNVKTSSTSHLSETIRGNKVEYSPDNLFKFITYIDHSESVNPYSIPWVEGKDDYGIGEYIEFELDYSSYRSNDYDGWIIEILNGYVNPEKPHLYKQNSRIKKASVFADGKKVQDVCFNDYVELTNIKIPGNIQKVKIVIDEVYEGSKYKDTCVTGISAARY